MKSPAKKLIIAMILGGVLLNAGLLFAQNIEAVPIENEIEICSAEDNESAERKREFWDKFRESVTPREKDPPPVAENPREVHPEEIHPEKDE